MHATLERGEDGGQAWGGPQATKELEGLLLRTGNETLEKAGTVLDKSEVLMGPSLVDAIDASLETSITRRAVAIALYCKESEGGFRFKLDFEIQNR